MHQQKFSQPSHRAIFRGLTVCVQEWESVLTPTQGGVPPESYAESAVKKSEIFFKMASKAVS